MWHVKDQHITTEELRKRFNNIPSVQTLVDVRRMKFLGSIIRGHVNLPPRQILIAFVPNTRPVGRPIKCNKEGLWESLKRLMEPVPEINITFSGSLKDWYLDALDNTFWNGLIAHLRDNSKPVPVRPNREASFNPRRSERRAPNDDPPRHADENTRSDANISPPRQNTRRSRAQSGTQRDYDPENVGKVLYDSLKVFNLGYGATIREVKAEYRSLARVYHPDKHQPEQTGMSDEDSKKFFQLINNAHTYLRSKL